MTRKYLIQEKPHWRHQFTVRNMC